MAQVTTTNQSGNTPATKQPATLQSMLSNDGIKKRFEEIMGKKAPAFISSIISATKATPSLMKCEPDSIISSAVIAATLDLPIQPSLGFAWMVPYKKKLPNGQFVDVAQFQVGWRGIYQLAMRTGQYKAINAEVVYEGELVGENRFTGEYEFNPKGKVSDKVIGYMAYFKLTTGFEKTIYWPKEKIEYHAKRFSKTYGSSSGIWNTDFDEMAKKTVLKNLLSKFGMLSVEMQDAIIYDQAEIKDNETMDVSYPDNDHKITTEEGMVIDTNPTKQSTGQALTEKAKEKAMAKQTKEEPIQEAVIVEEAKPEPEKEVGADFTEPGVNGRDFDGMMKLSEQLEASGLTWDVILEKLKKKGDSRFDEPEEFYKFASSKLLKEISN